MAMRDGRRLFFFSSSFAFDQAGCADPAADWAASYAAKRAPREWLPRDALARSRPLHVIDGAGGGDKAVVE